MNYEARAYIGRSRCGCAHLITASEDESADVREHIANTVADWVRKGGIIELLAREEAIAEFERGLECKHKPQGAQLEMEL